MIDDLDKYDQHIIKIKDLDTYLNREGIVCKGYAKDKAKSENWLKRLFKYLFNKIFRKRKLEVKIQVI